MTVSGSSAARAAATAVLPTPVGPTRTGTNGRSGTPKPALQLVLGQLDYGRAAMHVVRRQSGGEEAGQQSAHLLGVELVPRLDGRPAREGRREALEPVLPPAEAAAREVRDQLLQAARSLEAGMRIGGGVDHDAAAGEGLDLEADAPQQLSVRVDRV